MLVEQKRLDEKSDGELKKVVDEKGTATMIRDPNAAGEPTASVLEN